MKRRLFDIGSVVTVLSPLVLAIYLIAFGSSQVDTSSGLLATADLKPAMIAVADAAAHARETGDSGPLLGAIQDLQDARDTAADGITEALPEQTAAPVIAALDKAVTELSASAAAMVVDPSAPPIDESGALADAQAAVTSAVATLQLRAGDSASTGAQSDRKLLALIATAAGMMAAALLLARRRAHRAQEASARASRTIRQMASRTGRAERRVRELSTTDALTRLPNRQQFLRELNRAITRARRTSTGVAVLMIDLDRFKLINDSLGHASGDRLLGAVARRLQSRLTDAQVLARFGGDEYLVMIPGLRPGASAAAYSAAGIASDLIEALRPSFEHEDTSLPVSACIGISVYPGRADGAEELIRQASAALYQAKSRGAGSIYFYDPADHNPAEDRLHMEAELRRAIEHDEFRLYYQPQVELHTARILGVEALIRWHHPQRGVVMPSDFVPLLEDMGEIVVVGRWAIRQACRDAQSWAELGLPPVRVGINLSVHQFLDPELLPTLRDTLQETGIDPGRLELEITETIAMTNVEPALRILSDLHEVGVRTALDDFGTGYSSLGRLNEFPVHTLKIDRSFISSLNGTDGEQALVKGVIALGHALELHIVAEGIENGLQADVLRTLGTDLAQGFVYSEAVDEPTMRALLRDGIDPDKLLAAAS